MELKAESSKQSGAVCRLNRTVKEITSPGGTRCWCSYAFPRLELVCLCSTSLNMLLLISRRFLNVEFAQGTGIIRRADNKKINLVCSTKQNDYLADAVVKSTIKLLICVIHPADAIPQSALWCPHTGPSSDVASKFIFIFCNLIKPFKITIMDWHLESFTWGELKSVKWRRLNGIKYRYETGVLNQPCAYIAKELCK